MTQNIMQATSSLPQVLVAKHLEATETTQLTGPASSAIKLGTATATNTSASAVQVSVSLVKSGGTAGAANRVATFSLAAGDSTVLSELAGHYLAPGDFVSTLAATASAVAFVVSGVVFS